MDFKQFQWLNETEVTITEDSVQFSASKQQDWFVNPVWNENGDPDAPIPSVPFFYTEVTGDFVFSSKVELEHKMSFDGCSIMALESDTKWMKIAFEATDYGTKAAVCMVTNGVSDDANGCDIDQDYVWFKLIRSGNGFSTHYSLDGENYRPVRVFRFPAGKTIKVGMSVQCPQGDSVTGTFRDIRLEHKTVSNLRAGR